MPIAKKKKKVKFLRLIKDLYLINPCTCIMGCVSGCASSSCTMVSTSGP